MKAFIVSLFIAGLTLVATFAVPQKALAYVEPQCDGSGSFLGLPTWYKYMDIGGANCEIRGPFQENADTGDGSTMEKIDWQQAASRVGLAIMELLLRVAAIIALVFVLYGGFKYITSQGDPEGAKNARNSILNALIGLVISMIATGIVMFIASRIS